jgi:hypothetical protein
MLKVINGPTISAGESLSDAVDCTEGQLVRITMPPEWTDASLTFLFSTDGVFFNEMYGLDGYAVKLEEVVPGSGVIIPEHVARAIAHIKFQSGSHGNPVEQEKERTFAVTLLLPNSEPELPPVLARDDSDRRR